jgi:tetratricopeptide (TPR) repeat protein
MGVMRLLGRGLQDAANSGAAPCAEPQDLIADRSIRAAAPDGYAAMGWLAEQSGDLHKALAVYELICQRGNAPTWVRQRLAAVAVAMGRTASALEAYESLAAEKPGEITNLLVLGHLLILAGRNAEACDVLGHAVGLIEGPEGECMLHENDALLECLSVKSETPAGAEPHGVDRVQMLTRRGLSQLARGRFVRANGLFEDAMNLVDTLLVTYGQWVLAQANAEGGALPAHLAETLISLAQLSDVVLQYLARTKLAGNLADVLRERQLRHDLATWATGGQEVRKLLQVEITRLRELSMQYPNHADLQYRLALCSRATGDLEAAARAFGRTLAVEPHHANCAARLAATLLQLKRPDEVLPLLRQSFGLARRDAERYYAVGVASTNAAKFDRAVQALARDLGVKFEQQNCKANLAMALGLMGIQDSQKDQWRNPQPCCAEAAE